MDNMKEWARSRTTADFSWNAGNDSLLKEIKGVISALLDGSKFNLERNTTITEQSVDVFLNGEKNRMASIWPKCRSHCVDLLLKNEYVDRLRLRMDLPEDIDNKPGQKSPRKFKAISIEKVIEIFDCLASL